MTKVNLGLIGYGTVGQGVVKFLHQRKSFFKDKYNTDFHISVMCDRSYQKKDTSSLKRTKLTKNINDVINNPEVEIVIELIGGMKPAKDIVVRSLKNGKHVITANKELIANCGKELFKLAEQNKRHLYFESSVGAGIPVIKTLSEGLAGNKIQSIFGIINGTCNYILTEMTKNNLSFKQALGDAQKKGFAESDPTLDINGMDSAHKLAILVFLAFGKFIKVKNIYTEGITHISHDDIEYAESLNLSIKLLAIAKKVNGSIEARVHPTLISKEHPIATINSIYNAVYLNSNPQGDMLLSGEGAGQMAAASGVISDLINLTAKGKHALLLGNRYSEAKNLKLRTIDQIETKFYLKFMVNDKPGVLAKITSILGQHGISINSVTQKQHNPTAKVPVIMLTDYIGEKKLRQALDKIAKLAVVKGKPVAIRMENLW